MVQRSKKCAYVLFEWSLCSNATIPGYVSYIVLYPKANANVCLLELYQSDIHINSKVITE